MDSTLSADDLISFGKCFAYDRKNGKHSKEHVPRDTKEKLQITDQSITEERKT